MGLLDKFKKVADVAKAATDQRPDVPDDLQRHWDDECVMVSGAAYHENAIAGVPNGGTIELKLRKHDGNYRVETLDGAEVGTIYKETFDRSRLSSRGTVVAEVYQPVYRGMEYIAVYVRLTDKQIAKAREMEALKFWFTVDASWWTGGSERIKTHDASVWSPAGKSGKQPYMFMDGNMALFRITPRMANYQDISDRVTYPIRMLIAEPKEGEHGPFWRVGLYF